MNTIAQDFLCNAFKLRIRWFTDAMIDKLVANRHKGTWSDCDLQYLSMRLTQEREELRKAIEERKPSIEVTREAADVANFAMMTAEVYMRIKKQEENEEELRLKLKEKRE